MIAPGKRRLHPAASFVAAFARLVSGATVTWKGAEPDLRQRIYFANHTSHLDFVVLWAALPPALRAMTRPVAAEDYWGLGRLRKWLAAKVFRAVLIPRASKDGTLGVSAAQSVLERTAAALEDGDSLILFPEGTRGSGGTVSPFRGGLYHICRRRPAVELVPVYIANLNRILPKGEFLPVPLLSRVVFGPPLQLGPEESKPAFLDRAMDAVKALQET
jgi:1-acyl-sn-glycerol-3-phosphate acyltransferase